MFNLQFGIGLFNAPTKGPPLKLEEVPVSLNCQVCQCLAPNDVPFFAKS